MHQYFLKEATFHKQWRNFDNKGWNFLYQKPHNLSYISIERDISSIWNWVQLMQRHWRYEMPRAQFKEYVIPKKIFIQQSSQK